MSERKAIEHEIDRFATNSFIVLSKNLEIFYEITDSINILSIKRNKVSHFGTLCCHILIQFDTK
ncbi:hypothetical protein PcaKH35_21260 [Parageobacillus caldoxylosilyticus]|nr:hypothetical protein PcaKH35_21260 [Parageobacillus caldoxylosilyticus]